MKMNDNNSLVQKLGEYFQGNVKISYVSLRNVIIVTKDDKVYEFELKYSSKSLKKINIDIKNSAVISFSSDKSINELVIQESIIDELCNKQVIGFKTSLYHTIALTCDGRIYCWGINMMGTLGNGIADKGKKYKPELNKYLSGKHIVDFSCGFFHSLLLTSDGEVYAFGWNKNGQIGTGDTEDMLTPYHVDRFNSEKIKAISCGALHSMVLSKNGYVYVWGNYGVINFVSGVLFEKTLIDSLKTPKKIETKVIFDKIQSGISSDLLLSVDGDLYDVSHHLDEDHFILHKFNENKKFLDIAKMVTLSIIPLQDISVAVSENNIFHVWGFIDGECFPEPKESEFKSFNDIFGHYLQVTYEPIRGFIPQFIEWRDDFIENKKYDNNFNELKKLGEGGFGEVFEVAYKDEMYAIKKIKLRKNDPKEFMKELRTSAIISGLKDKRIVLYFDVWLEEEKSSTEKKSLIPCLTLYIQMELCNGNLSQFIEEIGKNEISMNIMPNTLKLFYSIAKGIFLEIIRGVTYLHQHNIIHRDLKPDNIMLKIDANGVPYVKITDFGLVAIHKYVKREINENVSDNNLLEVEHTTDVGDIRYAAPEVLDGGQYNTLADIYSLGIVLNELYLIDANRDIEENYFESNELMKQYVQSIMLCDKMRNEDPIERPHSWQIINILVPWKIDKYVISYSTYINFNFNPNLSMSDSFMKAMMNLKPMFVLCECGIEITENFLSYHTPNCVPHLKLRMNSFKIHVDMLESKLIEKRADNTQAKIKISIFNEWQSVKAFEIIKTNMSDLMKMRLLEILEMSLKERLFDNNQLSEKFSLEFGGIWNVLTSTSLFWCPNSYHDFINIKIGKFLVWIYSNFESVGDLLFINKQIEILENVIQNKSYNQNAITTWFLLQNSSEDSLNMSESLLDKSIIKHFIEYINYVPLNGENYLCSALGVFANISDFTQLREQLMKKELLIAIVGFASSANFAISYLSSYFLANILSEGGIFWDIYFRGNEILNRDSVINLLKCRITEWETKSNLFDQFGFTSLKSFNRLLVFNDKIPQEVNYFAVWTLYRLTLNDNDRYFSLFKEDGCLIQLDSLIEVSGLEDSVKSLIVKIKVHHVELLALKNINEIYDDLIKIKGLIPDQNISNIIP